MENIATRNKIRASYCKCIYVCILYMVKNKKVLTHNQHFTLLSELQCDSLQFWSLNSIFSIKA